MRLRAHKAALRLLIWHGRRGILGGDAGVEGRKTEADRVAADRCHAWMAGPPGRLGGLGRRTCRLGCLWCVPAVLWIDVVHGRPKGAAYLTIAIVGVLGGLIAIA